MLNYAWLGMAVMLLSVLAGCSQSFNETSSADSVSENDYEFRPAESIGWSDDSSGETYAGRMQGQAGVRGGESQLPSPGENLAQNRKIIYQAELNIVVEDFGGVEKLVAELVKRHNGFVAVVNLDRLQGERRSGTWSVRIPVDNYEDFLNAAGDIGVPASQNQTAKDVTEEFVDIEARISNKKKLEERIIELLKRPDDKLQHVIEVERELSRVREEIERMEGRLRLLANQSSLTTVSLVIREEKDYVPPQAPTFQNRISQSWNRSLVRCRNFFENATVFVVANMIGFLIFVVTLLIGILILKRIVRWANKTIFNSPPPN